MLIAQTNRSGYKEAMASFRKLNTVSKLNNNKNASINTQAEGYRLTALSDSNELERFSSIVMTVFADENMKSAHQAYVQVLKTRYGNNVPPTPVSIEPEHYSFGGNAEVDVSQLSADLIDSLASSSINSGSAGTTVTSGDDELFWGI